MRFLEICMCSPVPERDRDIVDEMRDG
jgi:hypothetical protein